MLVDVHTWNGRTLMCTCFIGGGVALWWGGSVQKLQ